MKDATRSEAQARTIAPPPPAAGDATPPVGEHRVRTYEELDGACGREVFFRPERYRAADLGSVHPLVTVVLDGSRTWVCDLHDVSQAGVAFRATEPVTVAPDTPIRRLTISFDGYEAYRGEARVVSVRETSAGVVVGASFVDSLVDIEDVLHLRDVRNWNGEGARRLALTDKPWLVAGHERFKSLVGELALFLADSKQELSAMEKTLASQVTQGSEDSVTRRAMIGLLKEQFVSVFLRYCADLDLALRSASVSEWQALKEFSVRHLDAFMMEAPVLNRARHKPLGYPGDFEVMTYIYYKHFEGETLFARAVHLAAVMTPVSEAVRNRKDVIKARLRDLVGGWVTRRPIRIVSVGCGPALDIHEMLDEIEDQRAMMEIVLFDQDKLALGHAFRQISRLVASKRLGNIRVTYLHDSIKRLLKDPAIFGQGAAFDAIVCSGLNDYLQLRTAITLTRNLFGNLAPGGWLWVGNMTPCNPSRWIMEHHLDWNLIYRTPAEMTEFARIAAPEAEIDVVEEATGINPFVALHRV
jgi:extracellular factor (EF) 3-hydroxypalmitic acid methyl ester biosynthesis protein